MAHRAPGFLVWLWLCWLLSANAAGVPTDFADKLEAALLCRSEWSPNFWRDYFNTHLGKPVRTWGQASWYPSQGAQLGGVSTQEVFVETPDSPALMVGTLIPQPLESVLKTLQDNLKVQFQPVQTPDGTRYRSQSGSVLVGQTNQQTKWYCARWNTGNRP